MPVVVAMVPAATKRKAGAAPTSFGAAAAAPAKKRPAVDGKQYDAFLAEIGQLGAFDGE